MKFVFYLNKLNRTSCTRALILPKTLSFLLKKLYFTMLASLETVETSSKEHLPISVYLTYFPSFFALSLPALSSGYTGQVIPLTLAETDVVHL